MANDMDYLLRLYIAGISTNNIEAVRDFKQLLDDKFHENYRLEVIDIFENPHLAAGEKIVATPTLMKLMPPPIQKVILDFNNKERLLLRIDLILQDG